MHVQARRRTYPESEVYSERSDRTALDDTIVLNSQGQIVLTV